MVDNKALEEAMEAIKEDMGVSRASAEATAANRDMEEAWEVSTQV